MTTYTTSSNVEKITRKRPTENFWDNMEVPNNSKKKNSWKAKHHGKRLQMKFQQLNESN